MTEFEFLSAFKQAHKGKVLSLEEARKAKNSLQVSINGKTIGTLPPSPEPPTGINLQRSTKSFMAIFSQPATPETIKFHRVVDPYKKTSSKGKYITWTTK